MLRNRIDPTITRLLTRLTDIACVLAKPERWPQERIRGAANTARNAACTGSFSDRPEMCLPKERMALLLRLEDCAVDTFRPYVGTNFSFRFATSFSRRTWGQEGIATSFSRRTCSMVFEPGLPVLPAPVPLTWGQEGIATSFSRRTCSMVFEPPRRIANMHLVLCSTEAPDIRPSRHCFQPHDCEFWQDGLAPHTKINRLDWQPGL